MVVVRGVHMVGPLEPYAEGLACELARLGFTELSAGWAQRGMSGWTLTQFQSCHLNGGSPGKMGALSLSGCPRKTCRAAVGSRGSTAV